MTVWKGLILAGGTGSRLFPLTQAINKHLLPVYDKPMIYYPISVLMLAGIRDIVIVSNPESVPQLQALLDDGHDWGLSIRYCVQPTANGIADGMRVAEDEVGGNNVALILGDNIFYGAGLQQLLEDAVGTADTATVFAYEVANPSAFGIITVDASFRPLDIVEKPRESASRLAVTGLYLYPRDVFDIVRGLKPSARGELEITDVNRAFLEAGRLAVRYLGRGVAWLDGGTPEDLSHASEFVRVIEDRTGLKISCPEEIAWRLGYIDAAALRALGNKMPDGAYRDYVRGLA